MPDNPGADLGDLMVVVAGVPVIPVVMLTHLIRQAPGWVADEPGTAGLVAVLRAFAADVADRLDVAAIAKISDATDAADAA